LPKGELRTIARSTKTYAGWRIEHPVKKFPEDMHLLEPLLFRDISTLDTSEIDETIEGVGEKGLVTSMLGDLFTSFLAHFFEGGYAAVINALLDYPDYCRELRDKFTAHQEALAEAICKQTKTEALFVNSGYSAPPITSPIFYREWDIPALAAAGAVAKKYGVALHVHQHGRAGAVIEDLIRAGVTIVCPLFTPPQGDVENLAEFKQKYGNRIALKGNIDPFGALFRGTPEQVEAEVKACIEAGAQGGGFILGTQDSTLAGTPFENIRALVAAGRKYGRYESEAIV
jgi:uroporphyrinogen-III decarboxylase